MSKISKISGFPEFLPGQKLAEEQIVARIRQVYQRAGFVPIETPAVELLSTLQAKGSVDKEIYVLRRLHAEGDEREELALHFDLTVPFSRYVAQHFASLNFPFKRYQLQKVWRGERPQKGRYREFYQFDIDIICRDDLPVSCDAEAIDVFAEALSLIGLPEYEIRINDRKILLGFYEALGLNPEQQKKTISMVDKLDKIGRDGVLKGLQQDVALDAATAQRILDLTDRRLAPKEAAEVLGAMQIDNPLFAQGVQDTLALLELISEESLSRIVIDLSLARGLDYYTGLILEVRMKEYPEFGSIGSGGRYDNLASEFTSQKLPGVGFSIGLSRILGFLFEEKRIEIPRDSTTEVLIAVYNEEQRRECARLARDLRREGVAAEVYFKSPKLGKQLDFADARGIPYVLFVGTEDGSLQVKDLRSKEQSALASVGELVERVRSGRSNG